MDHALSPETLLRHEEFVLRLARTLVRGEADAREVAQRTLVAALEHPPRHGGVRAWLARVTRNQAHELHRGERRRSARERTVARPEAVEAGASAVERLELEHGVVRAVLSLDEPYRGVVVATYYEGLAPAEIAERRGVPAGTVRSQLSRAHEMLRAKLDKEHGERATWMRGMAGLLALRDAAPAATAGSGLALPLAIAAGIAACVAGVLVVRAAIAPTPDVELAAVEPAATPPAIVATVAVAPAAEPARAPVDAASVAQSVARSEFEPADEPAKLLEQSRQIKKLILERRLAVTAEERARAGIPADTATSGVVRLLDRDQFGFAFSLPWMREGGSYYSFTGRVHDFNRRPQISYAGGLLGGDLLVDLGIRRLNDIPHSRVPPDGLDAANRLRWDVAHAELDPSRTHLEFVVAERIRLAQEAGTLDEDAAQRARPVDPTARPGRAFLLRALANQGHDVLVALEIVDVSPGQCTIAYRVLASRPFEESRTPYVAPDFAIELPPAAPELARMAEPELRRALDAVRARADEIVFESIPPDVERRFVDWVERPDAGVTRLMPYFSRWSELTTSMTGNADYEFLARRHDGYGDVSLQGELGHRNLGDGLSGGAHGVFVDLGTTPIERVTAQDVPASGEAGELAAQHEFPHPTDLPAVEPARRDARRAADERCRANWEQFADRARELGISDRARAIVGRTFAVRSVRFGSHDLLAAVQVVAEDERGIVIAWRVLRTWPVTKLD